MRALCTFLLLLFHAGAAAAQEPDAQAEADTAPILRMSLDEDSAIPGQPVILRVQVLAPTFLPKPPVFPSFEVPSVMVRLPERASGPTSERIGRDTWSGVSRAYRLYPMTPGSFRIPPQPVTVTYADPETSAPLTVDLLTEEIAFRGVAPQGAEDLEPFIAAAELVLEQALDGDPAAMAPGDSVTRVVTARIEGTSPLFLPPLIPALQAREIAAYPSEPKLEETEDHGVLSGVRTEAVTYIAEVGGGAVAPQISLGWFNIDTQRIETAMVPGIDFAVSGPVAPTTTGLDWATATPIILGILVMIALTALFLRLAGPRLAAWRRRRHAAWLSSERRAFQQAEAAVRARRYGEAFQAIARWSSYLPDDGRTGEDRLTAAMARLGETIYGRRGAAAADVPRTEGWEDVLAALRAARRNRRATSRDRGHALPPLNPARSGP